MQIKIQRVQASAGVFSMSRWASRTYLHFHPCHFQFQSFYLDFQLCQELDEHMFGPRNPKLEFLYEMNQILVHILKPTTILCIHAMQEAMHFFQLPLDILDILFNDHVRGSKGFRWGVHECIE